jgi:hypothetical protein
VDIHESQVRRAPRRGVFIAARGPHDHPDRAAGETAKEIMTQAIRPGRVLAASVYRNWKVTLID